LEKNIVNHNTGTQAPFAVITFKFARLDATQANRVLKNLNLQTGVLIHSYGKRYETRRTSFGYHVENGAVAVMVCYQHTDLLLGTGREAVGKDVQAIATAFEVALSVFDS